MNHTTMMVLFGIPLVCIVVIGINQIKDEMFKKKFEIERRKREASEPRHPDHSRRYGDLNPPGDRSNMTN